jgi:hypothetical protein
MLRGLLHSQLCLVFEGRGASVVVVVVANVFPLSHLHSRSHPSLSASVTFGQSGPLTHMHALHCTTRTVDTRASSRPDTRV